MKLGYNQRKMKEPNEPNNKTNAKQNQCQT